MKRAVRPHMSREEGREGRNKNTRKEREGDTEVRGESKAEGGREGGRDGGAYLGRRSPASRHRRPLTCAPSSPA